MLKIVGACAQASARMTLASSHLLAGEPRVHSHEASDIGCNEQTLERQEILLNPKATMR